MGRVMHLYDDLDVEIFQKNLKIISKDLERIL